MEEKEIKIYEPDNFLKKGIFFIFREICGELHRNIWFGFQMFKRDYFAMYRQSLVGISWAFLLPLISVGTFVLLNRSGIFDAGTLDVPYPLFAVLGMTFWQVFATGVIAGTNSLANAGSMIVKINFSKKTLVFASYAQFIIPFIVQMSLAGLLFIFYGISPSAYILLVPVFVLPVVFLGLAVSLVFAMLNAVLRDIGNIISIGVTFLMFLTPVLYKKPETGLLAELSRYNPLFYLVDAPREMILSGGSFHVTGFIVSNGVSLILFLIALAVFHITEIRIAER